MRRWSRWDEGGARGYYHSGAEAYITRPPLFVPRQGLARSSLLLPRRESRGGGETCAPVCPFGWPATPVKTTDINTGVTSVL